MSEANFRSRSPHMRDRRSPNKRKNSEQLSPNRGESKPLWRRRREEAEADDYKERLSPNRKQSISPCRERRESWHELDEDDNDEYTARAERAFSGLNRYEKKFKKYTPDVLNKENNQNFSNQSTTPTRERSLSPKPVEIESDGIVLIRRQKDIDYGKNTAEYMEYVDTVKKTDRKNEQPWTPDKYEKMTRRNWDKQVKIWRKQLHYWRDPKPVKELMTPGTSPCPSPHRRRSPERDSNPSSRQLFKLEDDDCAMDGIPTTLDNSNKQQQQQQQPSSGVQPILSQAALTSVKGEHDEMDDGSRMSCDMSDVPTAFKKQQQH